MLQFGATARGSGRHLTDVLEAPEACRHPGERQVEPLLGAHLAPTPVPEPVRCRQLVCRTSCPMFVPGSPHPAGRTLRPSGAVLMRLRAHDPGAQRCGIE